MAATATEAAMAGERPYNVLNYPKTGDQELDTICGVVELLNKVPYWTVPRILDYLQERYSLNRVDAERGTKPTPYDYANQPSAQGYPVQKPGAAAVGVDITQRVLRGPMLKPDPALERLRDRVPDRPKPPPGIHEKDALDRLNEELSKKLDPL